ncbi:DUF86 domain-containing protein [Cellulomonas sp. PhB150]|uniref:HepT-like ribonuclease domain-containing protein n=1 Tax=Cellulomonas sp. PhB150 TaxID=2485188 RepID=UPI0013155E0E|nr:HepT-like ribonuclease domain-containing protein [Cellulomonas sp. PhB150]
MEAIDAITYRIITIGEAAKALSSEARAGSDVSWSDIARMRDLLTHHYHRRDVAVVRATVDGHLDALRRACVVIEADR